MQNLDKILEGLLFLSGDGVDRGIILEKLQITPKELDKAIEVLKKRYDKDCGITFITYKDKLQLCGNQAFADSVSLVLNPIRERQLTRSTLEVMAIIAYKQPVTRLDVQEIRGINSDYAIQTLLNYKLIEVVGRKDAVGKPLLFGTTDEFLRHFGLNNLTDLPNYNELLKSIQQIELQNNHLYNEFEIPDDNNAPKGTEQNGDKPVQEEQPESKEQNANDDRDKKSENAEKDSANATADNQSKNLVQAKIEVESIQNEKQKGQEKKIAKEQTQKTINTTKLNETTEKIANQRIEQQREEKKQQVDESSKEKVGVSTNESTPDNIAISKNRSVSVGAIPTKQTSISAQIAKSEPVQDVKNVKSATNQDESKPVPKRLAKKTKNKEVFNVQTESNQTDNKLDGIDWNILEDNPDILD